MDVPTDPTGMELDVGKRACPLSTIQAVASAGEADRASTHSEGSDVCWICLDGARRDAPLTRACACPRLSHEACRARWQLQSAGSRKETHCEFCDLQLPDWKGTLTPHCGAAAPAVMNVNFDGRTYSFEVKPGIEGYRQFTEAIRRAFSLPEDSELNITFTCDEPATGPAAPSAGPGSLLTLQGAGAYDAAVHCASVSAARRLQSAGGGGGGGGPPTAPASPLPASPPLGAAASPGASGRGGGGGGPLGPAIPPPTPASQLPAWGRVGGGLPPSPGRPGGSGGGSAGGEPAGAATEGGAGAGRQGRGLLGRKLRDLLFKS